MRMTTMTGTWRCSLLTSTPALAALDCARVKELSKSGARAVRHRPHARPHDPRRAGVSRRRRRGARRWRNPPSKLPLAPQRPAGDGLIRRAPDGQESEVEQPLPPPIATLQPPVWAGAAPAGDAATLVGAFQAWRRQWLRAVRLGDEVAAEARARRARRRARGGGARSSSGRASAARGPRSSTPRRS